MMMVVVTVTTIITIVGLARHHQLLPLDHIVPNGAVLSELTLNT